MSREARETLDAERCARAFHEAYERLAPSFGYETRKASAVPWDDVPEQNKALMVAVAGEVVASELSAARARENKLKEAVEQAATFLRRLDGWDMLFLVDGKPLPGAGQVADAAYWKAEIARTLAALPAVGDET